MGMKKKFHPMKIKFPLHETKVFFKGNGKVVQGYIAFPNNSIYFATPFVSSGAGLQGANFPERAERTALP